MKLDTRAQVLFHYALDRLQVLSAGIIQTHRSFHLAAKALTAREAYQVLRDLALEVRTMRRVTPQSWAELYCGSMTVEADGWVLTFYNDCGTLDYCASCYSPDGHAYVFDSRQSYGTDPIQLLSTWEHAQLERLLSVV